LDEDGDCVGRGVGVSIGDRDCHEGPSRECQRDGTAVVEASGELAIIGAVLPEDDPQAQPMNILAELRGGGRDAEARGQVLERGGGDLLERSLT
jgi:hypothetical protein